MKNSLVEVRMCSDILVEAVSDYKSVGVREKKVLARLFSTKEDIIERVLLELLQKGYKVPILLLDTVVE